MNAQELSKAYLPFEDSRLPDLLFRYRARNWPETLSSDEQQQWVELCADRFSTGALGGYDLNSFKMDIEKLSGEPLDSKKNAILSAVVEYMSERETSVGN